MNIWSKLLASFEFVPQLHDSFSTLLWIRVVTVIMSFSFTRVPVVLFLTAVATFQCSKLQASTLVYASKSDFLNATGAVNVAGPYPNLPTSVTTFSTGSGVTISPGGSATRIFLGTAAASGLPYLVGSDWTTRLPGNDLALIGPESLDIDFVTDIFSFGFDFVEPEFDTNIGNPGDFVDSTFTISLLDGSNLVDEVVFSPPNDTATFFGIGSVTPFDSVQIRETVGGAENEFFGHLFAGTAAVPEPATYCSALSLAGICLFRRRRTKSITV
ncbi:MAG: hypothetical protein AAGD07_04365 [Planctomycetota bacterium]